MCYKPLPTGMERVKILGNLRLPEIKFPEDFNQYELQNQVGFYMPIKDKLYCGLPLSICLFIIRIYNFIYLASTLKLAV
jgi:hypothetical protein